MAEGGKSGAAAAGTGCGARIRSRQRKGQQQDKSRRGGGAAEAASRGGHPDRAICSSFRGVPPTGGRRALAFVAFTPRLASQARLCLARRPREPSPHLAPLRVELSSADHTCPCHLPSLSTPHVPVSRRLDPRIYSRPLELAKTTVTQEGALRKPAGDEGRERRGGNGAEVHSDNQS